MENAIKILILEHDPNDLELLQYALKKIELPYVSEIVQTRNEFEKALSDFKPAIILSDFSLPSFDGFSAFLIKERISPATPFIIVSGTIGEENAVQLIKNGVTDYVLKERLYQIGPKIQRALKEAEARDLKEHTERQLKKREEHFRNIMNLSLDVIYTLDHEGRILTISPAAKLILDYQPEELVGRQILDLIHEEDKAKAYKAIVNLKNGIDIINLESRCLRRSGTPVTLLWSVRWHSDEIGYGVAKEITAIKKAEEKLKNSEKRFRALIQNSTDGLTLLAEDGTVIERSLSALKILELNPNDEGGKFRTDLVHPDDRFAIQNATIKVKKTPELITTVEYRMLMPSGTYKWIETTLNNLLAEPEVNAIVLNFRDITQRKLAEIALKKSELILKKGEELAKLGSWYEDLNSGKGFWSEQTFQIFGLSQDEIIPSKESYFSFIHPDDLPKVEIIIEQAFKNLTNIEIHHRIIRKDGEIRYVYLESKFDFDPITRENILFGVLQDVTEQKLIEKKLRNSEARLKEAQAIGKIGNWEVNFITGNSEWSDEIYQMFGIEKGSIVPSTEEFKKFIFPDDLELIRETVKRTRITQERGTVNFRFSRTEGEIRYGLSDWRFVSDKQGNTVSMFGIMQDITEIKLAEIALEQSEEKYRSIFQLSPLPMWVFDVETYRFLNVNEAAIRHYGYSYEEFLNMTIQDIRPDFSTADVKEIVEVNKQTKVYFKGTFNHFKKNGEQIQVEIQSNLIEYEGRQARIVLAKDVSDKLRYVKAIEDQNKKLREIAWIQSHVVRAPLARIMGLISILKDKPARGENFPELVGYLTSSAHELDSVIRNIINETESIEPMALK